MFFEKVTHILVDPSCSGSGMTNRLKFGANNEQELTKDKKRLWNLEALQRRLNLNCLFASIFICFFVKITKIFDFWQVCFACNVVS